MYDKILENVTSTNQRYTWAVLERSVVIKSNDTPCSVDVGILWIMKTLQSDKISVFHKHKKGISSPNKGAGLAW